MKYRPSAPLGGPSGGKTRQQFTSLFFMVSINNTLLRSVALKSHRTSGDFTADCQATLQNTTPNSQIILQKLIPEPDTPPRTKMPMVWFDSAVPSL